MYLTGEGLFEYKGYIYCPEDDIEEDNVKTFHHVSIIKNGKLTRNTFVPLSPYSILSKTQFIRWIDMGKPTRSQMQGHHHRDHTKYWESYLDKLLLGEQ